MASRDQFCMGVVMTLMAFVKTYPQLVVVRTCLGVAEAGLFPGVVYHLTLWYPRHMLQYRIGLFLGAATIGGAFSGLLSFGFGYIGGMDGLEAWSWIFMLEGLATIVAAIIAVFVLVDFPDTAKFLTPEERAFVVWRRKNTTIHRSARKRGSRPGTSGPRSEAGRSGFISPSTCQSLDLVCDTPLRVRINLFLFLPESPIFTKIVHALKISFVFVSTLLRRPRKCVPSNNRI
ncbi:MFS general substrate transporter [Suillus weaverae]|nr:MFS general substrate transporter [Suillus weaverae]